MGEADESPLGREIREIIAAEGPIGIDRYMALALGHPVHGYYTTRDPLGRAGDFTTAPEISQMFGELLGLWAAGVWIDLGRPSAVHLVELGPGRGTLMADALRAARVVPEFLAAAAVNLVETSPALRTRQRDALAGTGARVQWHERFEDVPDGPVVVLANEFLDALPIRQFVRVGEGWRERLVGLDESGRLGFGLASALAPELAGRPGEPGEVAEVGVAAGPIVTAVARRIAAHRGAALFVDYGHVSSANGDTLQAVSRHSFADPLARPGEADLTAHVDFARVAGLAGAAGAAVFGPVDQGVFLRSLGIVERAERLKARADSDGRAAIDSALARLTGPGPGEMGRLFKAIGLAHPALVALPGFPAGDRPPGREADP